MKPIKQELDAALTEIQNMLIRLPHTNAEGYQIW